MYPNPLWATRFRVAPLSFVLLLLPVLLFATPRIQQKSTDPNKALNLKSTPSPIKVDGELKADEWVTGALVKDFTEFQPNEGSTPGIKAEAWITYDAMYLYVGYRVTDEPSALRSTNGKRDEVWSDDWVAIALDTYRNNSYFLLLGANPSGIQVDSRGNGNNDDSSYNLIYTSAGRKTETGYEVEMAIPFSSLSFPNKEVQSWGVNFLVNHPRASRHMYAWPALTQNNACTMCQFGTLENIKGVKSGSMHYQILPALVGSNEASREDSANPGSPFTKEKLGLKNMEPSLNLKLDFNSNTSAEMSFNPDFSQIESDADQISVNSTLALFYPERRPFFQEGADLFDQESGFNFGEPFQTVYTRSMNAPLVATKFISRQGQSSFGYIGAMDEHSPIIIPLSESSEVMENGRSISNILRFKQAMKGGNYIAALLTDRRMPEGGSGSVVALDGKINFSPKYYFTYQLNGSRTEELNNPTLNNEYGLSGTFDQGRHTVALDGETFTGHSGKIGFIRQSREWNFYFGYDAVSPTFRADNGFVSQNNFRQANIWQGYSFYFKDRFITQVRPAAYTGRIWSFDNKVRDTFLGFNMNIQMKGQSYVGFNTNVISEEVFHGVQFKDLRRINMWGGSNFSKNFGFDIGFNYGNSIRRTDTPEPGRQFSGWGGFYLRPFSGFEISPNISYAMMKHRTTGEEFYRGFVSRTTLTYQASRAFNIRLVGQVNSFSEGFSLQPLLTYQVNPLTVFYVGANLNGADADDATYPQNPGLYTTDRSVFFKFQYMFRR
ncbi:MAG TPA: sugar-binding protein [Rhodothermales bacterium]|nr:sugar-binding protein [Rhodothermales bacterium]